jgi:predicted DNA-binding protein
MISIRLDSDLEDKLKQIAEAEKLTKSDVIKRALKLYFKEYEHQKSAYELGDDLFGKYGSGKGNLSMDYKIILKSKLNEKYSR